MAVIGTGELTEAPFSGLEIVKGKPHNAAGGGSVAGGTTEVFAGGVGVTGQLATLAGRPWHPIWPPKIRANPINSVIAMPRCI